MFPPKRSYYILTIVTCTIGLILQVKEVSEGYFSYPTGSKVVVLPHFFIRVPSLSACLRFADILKIEEVNKELKMNLFHPDESIPSWTEFLIKARELSVGNRFKFTPRVDEVLSSKFGCAIRFPRKDHLEYFTGKKCYEKFNITKYYHRESVCYKFTPKLDTEILQVKHYTLSDEAYGLLYFLMMNETLFQHVKVVSSYIHDDNSIQLYDALLAQYIMIPSNKAEILTTFNTLKIESLEPPFDTNCQKYPEDSAMIIEILKNIRKEALIKLNRSIPALMIHDRDIESYRYADSLRDAKNHRDIENYRDTNREKYLDDIEMNSALVTSYELYLNEALRFKYREIVEKYQDIGRNSCSIRCLISKISYGKDENFQFRVSWPDGLYVDIEYTRRNTIIDLIVYICSSVGIWFGISAFSLFASVRNFFPQYCGGRKSIGDDTVIALRGKIKKLQKINDWRYYHLKKKFDTLIREKFKDSVT